MRWLGTKGNKASHNRELIQICVATRDLGDNELTIYVIFGFHRICHILPMCIYSWTSTWKWVLTLWIPGTKSLQVCYRNQGPVPISNKTPHRKTPQSHEGARSVVKNARIAPKSDGHISSNAAAVPAKSQSKRTILNLNLAASRLQEIPRQDDPLDTETGSRCHNTAIQYNTTVAGNKSDSLNSQFTPHTSPSQASHGVSIVWICDKDDHDNDTPW